MLQISLGRLHGSGRGLVQAPRLTSNDDARALRKFQTKDAVVAKLFAKHIKLRGAIEYVKKTRFSVQCIPRDLNLYADYSRVGIGIGTPSRIIDLLDSGILHFFPVEH